jgi:hypothetical protein
MRKIVGLVVFAASVMSAQDRPEMSGTWLIEAGHAGKSKITTLAIRQSADTIEISEAGGPESKAKKIDLACSIGGQTCKIKEADEEVSFWYNGSALVMMETRHGKDVVIKTRLEPSEDGKTLRMQVVHIAPAGLKDESYTLTRQAGS